MTYIKGDIWVAVSEMNPNNCIQVIDVEGNIKRDIRCAFEPFSVKQAPWGDIIVASDTGLHVLCCGGIVQSTICGDVFFDLSFFGEEVVALNGSREILQTYSRSDDGEWRHSGDIAASQGIGSNIDSVVK